MQIEVAPREKVKDPQERGFLHHPGQTTMQWSEHTPSPCGLIGLLLFCLAASGCDSRPPPIGCAPADATLPQRRYPLNDQANHLAQTEPGRELIKYLTDCALCGGVAAYTDVAGQHYEFPDALGLAPQWLHQPLTEDEQRWVSACILARTNYFGIEVKISMRAEHSPYPVLQTTDQERREFTLHEGDFFGNLFAVTPVAAVALGGATLEQHNDPVFKLRVCAIEGPNAAPLNGKKLSRCRFIITGDARDPNAHILNGQHYDQYISVYLKPQAPSTPPSSP